LGEDFWDLTFEELDALIERHRLRDRRDEYRTLQIVCACYNAQRTDKKQKVWKPEDFLPSEDAETPEEESAPKIDPLFHQLDAWAMARYGINNQGELEARERIAREEAEALAASEASRSTNG
jgi:hypothetical protein